MIIIKIVNRMLDFIFNDLPKHFDNIYKYMHEKIFAPNIEKLETNKDIDGLIKSLKYKTDYFIPISLRTIYALGRSGDTRAIDPLIELLKENKYSDAVAEALILIGKPTVERLALSLNNYRIRMKATEIFVEIGDHSIEPLIELLKNEDNEIRKIAIESLDIIGNKKAIEPLIGILEDEDKKIRLLVIKALKKMNGLNINHLLKALTDNFQEIRNEAAEVLDEKGWKPSNIVETTYYLIGKNKWDNISEMGISSLEVLLKAIENKDYDNTIEILEILKNIDDKKIVLLLITILKNNDYAYYHEFIVSILLSKGDKIAAETILVYLAKHPLLYDHRVPVIKFTNFFGKYGKAIAGIFCYHLYKLYDTEWDTEYEVDYALQGNSMDELMNLRSSISNNILHILKQLVDLKVTTGYHETSTTITKVNREIIRNMASLELEKRGNPPYDASIFQIEEEWMK